MGVSIGTDAVVVAARGSLTSRNCRSTLQDAYWWVDKELAPAPVDSKKVTS
jgi:hypothetical protein